MQRTGKLIMASLMMFMPVTTNAGDYDFLEKGINEIKEQAALPSGTAVLALKDGKVVYEGYFGYADLENRKKVTQDTVFYIASTTKPFLALNSLILEQEDKLSRDDSLSKLFPNSNFEGLTSEHRDQVTVKHLLSHTAAIDNFPLVIATAFSGIHDKAGRLKLIEKSEPMAKVKPGEFAYTNVGYNILSVWYEQVLDTAWQDSLDEDIFTPLGMSHTSAYISEADKKGWPLARPYSLRSPVPREKLYLEKQDNTMQAAGGLISSASDLGRFMALQTNPELFEDKINNAKSLIKESHTGLADLDKSFMDFKRSQYAWGWYIGDYKTSKLYHHFGGFAGFHSHLSFMPEEGLALVVLNNEDMLSTRMTAIIADAVYGVLLEEEGIQDKITERFKGLSKLVEQAPTMKAKGLEKLMARPWLLTLPKSVYAGSYVDPLYGELKIRFEGGELYADFGNMHSAAATAFVKQDSIRVELIPNQGDVLQFTLDNEKVAAVTMGNMTFNRQ